jgi:DNA-directed RNA polymerase specialized sigma subunit
MILKFKRNLKAIEVQRKVEKITKSGGKYITKEELAQILGMSVKDAVKKAVELRFSRIPVKGSHYYSKRQVQAYLNSECRII